jgi:hypothetical protein
MVGFLFGSTQKEEKKEKKIIVPFGHRLPAPQ